MPTMYRAGGVRKSFRSVEEGLNSGFLPSFNDVAKAQAAKLKTDQDQPPLPESEAPPAPPPPLETAPANAPPPPAAKQPLPEMSLEEVKAQAERFGLDTSVHHMTLRKQVEECLNAEGGAD